MVEDNTTPSGKWTFDGDVAAAFDNMLERSIPQYEVMRKSCFDLGCQFISQKTDVVDLGCSRGEALAPFISEFGAYNRFWGIDVSGPMMEAARERFKGYIEAGIVEVRSIDLRADYPPVRASLTLAVLVLQFTPD